MIGDATLSPGNTQRISPRFRGNSTLPRLHQPTIGLLFKTGARSSFWNLSRPEDHDPDAGLRFGRIEEVIRQRIGPTPQDRRESPSWSHMGSGKAQVLLCARGVSETNTPHLPQHSRR